MANFRVYVLFFMFLCCLPVSKSELFSNKFLMKADLTTKEAKVIAEKYGFTFHKQIKSIKQERYLELAAHDAESESMQSLHSTEFSVTDPYWRNMWHLHPEREPNMGVYKAWCRGYTGKGVTLGFLDSSIDLTQTDLQRNYVPELAYDYLDDDDDPSMNFKADESSHGTKCAGIAVAEKNNSHCIVGIAYDAKFTNLRTLDENEAATYSELVLAFTHRLNDIDVYSNSWGKSYTAYGFPESQTVITDAFWTGIYTGRGGKGAIYTFSSGNGGDQHDCNIDIYVSSIYTIAVNSVAYDGSPASYAETCTAVMTSAFGGSPGSQAGITTTDSNNMCTTTFKGTSAACPMVTGIIALTLQANPELTWRDIQHLIVETATTSSLKNGSFVTNGSGRNVSLLFGFGLINADAMISRALTWKTVPDFIRHSSAKTSVNKTSYYGTILSSKVVKTNITHIEQVRVWIKFRAKRYRSVDFNLTSPSGTENRLLKGQLYNSDYNTTWTALTVHCWGENPNGNWTLSMASQGLYNGYVGSPCYGTSCWYPHSVCDNQTKLCMCEDGYRNKTGFCIKEGDIGTECEGTQHCTKVNSVCNNMTGICECDVGQRALNGKCIKDGDYGGRCLLNGTCADDDIACDTYLKACVKCGSDSHKINDQCVKDGLIGGKCLSNGTCFDNDASCDSSNNTCVSCSRYFTAIDGICVRDRSLGGYCYYSCFTPHAHCNSSTNRCECRSGYNESTGSCNTDGFVGGKCLSNDICFDNYAVCDSSNDTCVSCSRYFTAIDGICVRDGSLGGYCRYRFSCSTPLTHCNSSTNRCECRRGYNESTGSCSMDGFVGGKCLSNGTCFDNDAVCDSSSNTCVSCSRYFTAIDGICIRDGSLGGYCRYHSSCSTPYTHCNSSTNRCECRSGFNRSTGSCNMDGHSGGKCLSNSTCFDYDTFCDSSNNTCVSCPRYHTIIDGKCVKDGDLGGLCTGYYNYYCTAFRSRCNLVTDKCECRIGYHEFNGSCKADGSLGGYCRYHWSCSTPHTHCNSSTNRCECRSRFNESIGSCNMDGLVGGKCLSNGSCFDNEAVCDLSNNTCISCSRYFTVIDGRCIRDGSLGGYCRYHRSCSTPHTHCNRSTSRCECRSGFNESTGSCNVDGHAGGKCLSNSTCFDDDTFCDSSNNTCVSCPRYHTIIGGKCVKDGTLGGLCISYYYCTAFRSRCSYLTYKCECRYGYHEFNGSCKADGYVGRRCISDSICLASNSICDSTNNTCVRCPNKHIVVGSKCVRDGNVGGRCLSNGTCLSINSICDHYNKTCVSCPEDNTVIDGKCVTDGTLDGYCHRLFSCFALHTRCNSSTNKCECGSGFNKFTGSCNTHGYVGGRCLSDSVCLASNSICDRSNNTCVRCPNKHTVVESKCVRDGSLGAYCQYSCNSPRTVCNERTNRCECRSRYKKSGRRCIQNTDGSLGAYCQYSCNSPRTVCNERTNRCECRSRYKKSGRRCIQSTDDESDEKCSLNQPCTDANTVCDVARNTCVKNLNNHREVDKTSLSLGSLELPAIVIVASIIVLAFAVIMLYKRLHGRNEYSHNTPVYV